MSWRKITFIIGALVVLLGGSYFLSELFISMKPEPRKRPDVERKRSVKTEVVTYSDILSPLRLEGRAVSGSQVTLVSEASGKIEAGEVLLRKGTAFKKGQLLAVIYKDEVELALKARKSKFLTTMTTLLPDLKVDYPDELQKYEAFFKAIDLDKSLPEMPKASNEKLKIFLASRNVFNEYYGIKQDEKRLQRHWLYAPFNGTFTSVNFELGAYVNTGGKIAEMIRTDKVEIEVHVPNADSRWIKLGDRVTVYSKKMATKTEGVVVRKSDFIEEDTQSRSIFVKVQNSGAMKLLTGEYKVVEFPGQKIEQAMELPRNAVFNSNTVFVVIDGKLKKREIEVLKTGEINLIFRGLEEGDHVVSEPLINVKENTPVTIFGQKTPQKAARKKQQNKQKQ